MYFFFFKFKCLTSLFEDEEIKPVSLNTENNLCSGQCIKFVLEFGVNVRLEFVCDSVNDGAPLYIID